MREDLALIQTVDFFTPVVDDPYTFGRIAAVNALSDIYAMGGEPITAMNLVAFPSCSLDLQILSAILTGGADAIREAGAVLLGGHTVEDNEPKYGLAVTGVVHPGQVVTNHGARPHDVLVLTKPIGVGVLVAAAKGEAIDAEGFAPAVKLMSTSNRVAAVAMKKVGVNACTDITGFGLLGHAYEMAAGSGWALEIDLSSVPVLPEARGLASFGLVPAGTYANARYLADKVIFTGEISEVDRDILFDPQTSGGLLIAVPADRADDLLVALRGAGISEAQMIGRVLDEPAKVVKVRGN